MPQTKRNITPNHSMFRISRQNPPLYILQDTAWSPHHREDMSQLDRRVAGFVDRLLRREAGHVFVVSHGVFIETALRQLAHAYPG